jgi:hypothetical protein
VAVVNLLASVLKASELLNNLADDFKLMNQGNMRHMDASAMMMNFDPSEMMNMGDEDGNNMLIRGYHQDR